MIGVVLAGGASRRFGRQPKGLVAFAGRPLALHVADRLGEFCSRVVIEATPGAGYEALGLALVHAPAAHDGKGPLAGLAAGLGLAAANEHVAFAPCDMPLLTHSIYVSLLEAAGEGAGAYASTRLGAEPLVAVLRAVVQPALIISLDGEPPRTHVVLDSAGARAVMFEDLRPFTNVNTPEDLDRLADPRG